MKHQFANILTGSRILGSILMVLFPVDSCFFYALYLFCGATDMIDGTVARRTNSVSDLGSKLDTAADVVFAVAALIKLLPVIPVPMWLQIWITVIAAIKASTLLFGLICRKTLVSCHTAMNKVTGVLLFLLPLTLPFAQLQYSAAVVCTAATVSSVQEGYLTYKD